MRLLAPLALVFAIAGPAFASGGGSSPADWNWVDFGYGDKDAEGNPLVAGKSTKEDVGKMAPPALFAIINFCIFAAQRAL